MFRQSLIICLLLTLAGLAHAVGDSENPDAPADCDPRAGFLRALDGAQDLGPCTERHFRVDFELGRNLRNLRQERDTLLEADASDKDTATRKRLRVVERELEQVEGLARIRGLLSGEEDTGR